MNTMILRTAIARLSELKTVVCNHPRWAAAVCGGVVVLAVAYLLFDWSDKLSQAQVDVVRAFVVRTNSPSVREQFNEEVKGGVLTVNGAERVIEVAKEQEPGYGLITDQKNNK